GGRRVHDKNMIRALQLRCFFQMALKAGLTSDMRRLFAFRQSRPPVDCLGDRSEAQKDNDAVDPTLLRRPGALSVYRVTQDEYHSGVSVSERCGHLSVQSRELFYRISNTQFRRQGKASRVGNRAQNSLTLSSGIISPGTGG